MKKQEKSIFNFDLLKKEIEDYIKYYDIELVDLAISIGMSENTLKRTLNNERDLYINEVYRLIDILHIKNEDIEKYFFSKTDKTPISSESKI